MFPEEVLSSAIRCKPSCSAPNPIIYTYLENYPVNPFSNSFNGGSGFPAKTGYPTQAEATAAIQSALSRPPAGSTLTGCVQADTALGCNLITMIKAPFGHPICRRSLMAGTRQPLQDPSRRILSR